MTETAWIIIALILTAPLWLPLVFIIILAALAIIEVTLLAPVAGVLSIKDILTKNSEEKHY